MQPTRRARLESVIREELTTLISRGLKDPRIPSLVITSVSVTPDGGNATVMISLFDSSPSHFSEGMELGEAAEKLRKDRVRDCLAGLASASGFLRRKLAASLNTRTIPTLEFKEDRGLANSMRVHELLKQIASAPAQPASEGNDGSNSGSQPV